MKDMEDIITDWLSGECSADEKNRLDAWIRESPENKEYFIQSVVNRLATKSRERGIIKRDVVNEAIDVTMPEFFGSVA